MNAYGMELTADFRDCNPDMFNRESIKLYFKCVCKRIGVRRGPLHFWDYGGDVEARDKAPPHLAGVSAVQFIHTSNITIHTLDKLSEVYLSLFACEEFNSSDVVAITTAHFGGRCYVQTTSERGVHTREN